MSRIALGKFASLVLISLVWTGAWLAAGAQEAVNRASDATATADPFSRLERLRSSGQSKSQADSFDRLRRLRSGALNNADTPWSGRQEKVWYGNPDHVNLSSDSSGKSQSAQPSGTSLTEARVKGSSASVSNMSQLEQTRLQMQMDRKTKAQSTMSNAIKKESDTSESIINNIK
jgi:hypothetical protein